MKSSCPTCHTVWIHEGEVPDYKKTECPRCGIGLRKYRRSDGLWHHRTTNLRVIYKGRIAGALHRAAAAGAVGSFFRYLVSDVSGMVGIR